MQRTTRWLLGNLWGLSIVIPLTASAVAVNFTGNLIQNPPCDVAGPNGINQPIKVQFGEVGITKINGVNYQQNFSLTLSCGDGLGESVALYLEYRGMQAGFDDKALQTSQVGLGVRLYYQGEAIGPMTGKAMTMSSNGTATLSLSAVPVKDPNPETVIYEGDFTATASVEMNYP